MWMGTLNTDSSNRTAIGGGHAPEVSDLQRPSAIHLLTVACLHRQSAAINCPFIWLIFISQFPSTFPLRFALAIDHLHPLTRVPVCGSDSPLKPHLGWDFIVASEGKLWSLQKGNLLSITYFFELIFYLLEIIYF